MDKIKLRVINQSNDRNNSQIVIFQKNVATPFDEQHVAWRVIENLAQGWSREFTYSLDMEIGLSDSYDNDSPAFKCYPGQLWHVKRDPSGDILEQVGAASTPDEVQIRNDLDHGAISACCYRDGKLLATKTGVAPGQKAVFKFKPMLFVGVASQVIEGDVLDSAIIADIHTELSLLGVASADIVVTGGGSGKDSIPFRFDLANVQRA